MFVIKVYSYLFSSPLPLLISHFLPSCHFSILLLLLLMFLLFLYCYHHNYYFWHHLHFIQADGQEVPAVSCYPGHTKPPL